MSKAFVCFRGGKPLNLSCRDSATSGKADYEEDMRWRRDKRTITKFQEEDARKAISRGLEERFDLVDRGTVTKETDLVNTNRAPDGMRNWSNNKDFVKFERERGNPTAVANPQLERSRKDG